MTIEDVLLKATKECNHDLEEEGGIILRNKELDDYEFVKVRNDNEGSEIAPVLWTADRFEYAKKIIPMLASWRHYASFHTHPKFPPIPSSIDLGTLFPGFPINFIYSQALKEISEWHTSEDNHTSFESLFSINNNKLIKIYTPQHDHDTSEN